MLSEKNNGTNLKSRKQESSNEKSKFESNKPQIFLPKCNNCGLKFLCEESLDRHKKSNHSGITTRGLIGQYQCDIDGKYFRTKKNIFKHIQDVHCSIRRYKCEICLFAFKTFRNLKKHLNNKHKIKATNEKKISIIPNGSLNCDLCSKSFRNRSSFYSHNYYVHPKVEYKCHLCEKSFKRKLKLKLHLMTHNND